MGVGLGCVFGCAKARLGPKGRSETCPSGSSSCLSSCLYSGVSEFVPGKPSPYSLFPGPYPRSLLSYSLCLMWRFTDHDPTAWSALRTMHHIALFSHSRSAYLVVRSADHQPNARSAQTGEVDKLMERSADH